MALPKRKRDDGIVYVSTAAAGNVGYLGAAAFFFFFFFLYLTYPLRSAGVILRDCGFGQLARCLEHFSTDDDDDTRAYFNFCCSSTRFIIERAFGRVKQGQLVLLRPNQLSEENA